MKNIKFLIGSLCLFINSACSLLRCKRKQTLQLVRKNYHSIPRSNSYHQGKLKLLLGLEGTLVSTSPKQIQGWQYLDVQFPSGVKQTFYLKHRPNLNEFLIEVSKLFAVSIYTTQVQEFAEPIIKTFNITMKHNLYRQKQFLSFTQSCVAIKGGKYKKDIGMIFKNPHDIIFVDSDEEQCKGMNTFNEANQANSYFIDQYRGDDNDNILLSLKDFLIQAHARVKQLQEEGCEASIQDVLEEMQDQ